MFAKIPRGGGGGGGERNPYQLIDYHKDNKSLLYTERISPLFYFRPLT